jgi:hypothetical protein
MSKCVLPQKIPIVPEDVSLLMTSFTNTLSNLSVKQGDYGLWVGREQERKRGRDGGGKKEGETQGEAGREAGGGEMDRVPNAAL